MRRFPRWPPSTSRTYPDSAHRAIQRGVLENGPEQVTFSVRFSYVRQRGRAGPPRPDGQARGADHPARCVFKPSKLDYIFAIGNGAAQKN